MTSLAQQVVMGLPPLEKTDMGSLSSLPGYSDDILKEYKARQCLDATNNSTNPMAEALLTELQKHQDKHFGGAKPVTARHTVTDGTDKDTLVIQTYAETMEPHKFLSGYWASKFTYETSSKQLSGTLSMHVHYFEDGSNVQYRATREFDAVEKEDAAAVAQYLNQITGTMHSDLCQLSDDGLQTSLKRVRRILPITKTRMKWDDAAQEQVRLLNKKKDEKGGGKKK